MTIGSFALLLGIFCVPAVLLWAGHRLRRRSARWQAAFWGGVAGHLAALLIGSVAAVAPAEQWAPTDVWRGALGLWSFLVLPAIGAAVGAVTASRVSTHTRAT
jgi:hypothetical protein